jgi:hypothetical protein
MFHLPYYKAIYHTRHIPIHYVLLVGYDDEAAYVHDTDRDDVQAISLEELRLAWDVNVPGMGKRNRFVVLDISPNLPPTDALIRSSLTDACQMMLRPPVSMVGIPAMRKLAREIVTWPAELGKETAAKCLRQVREYLNTPPDAEGDHLTAGRDLYIAFLQEAGPLAGLDFSEAIRWLGESMATVPALAEAIGRDDLEGAAACFGHIADAETRAYTQLSRDLGLTALSVVD